MMTMILIGKMNKSSILKQRNIRYIVLLGIFFLFLQSCCNKNNDKNVSNFLGKWHSVERDYPFSAVLLIDSDYNFRYFGGACVVRFSSNGNWMLNNDTLILNSVKPEECYYLRNFVNCLPPLKIIDEFGSIIDDFDSNDSVKYNDIDMVSMQDCVPESINYYVLFENEKFVIKDSALIHIQNPNNLCPKGGKYDFSRMDRNE